MDLVCFCGFAGMNGLARICGVENWGVMTTLKFRSRLPDPQLDQGEVDCVAFALDRLGFVADSQQALVLRAGISRGLLNCTRQWGKSTVIAVKAVHHAFTQPDRLVIVCSASARQSGVFCGKMLGFLRKLGINSLHL